MAGDAQATHALVEALMPDAFRVAVATLGAKHPDLDDAVQLGIMEVMKRLATFRHEASFRTYALLIVSRTAIKVRRKSQRKSILAEKFRLSKGVETDEEVVDDTSDPVDQGLRRVLNELLATLPDVQAEALLMRVVLDYDLDEIATHAGVPVNTVRSRVRLAREALRRRIEADPELCALVAASGLPAVKGGPGDE
ncbi:putative Ecf-type RNA polymerase sigma factor [Labilithrix luteola]|uniref:Putative Ecf-type RNA polymerase sigma factor n=1 Tax=Labilithrix luteola TaxID=1391654 RepID=A0A0K1PQY1_9BACT|nr:putative Ecf-type RNA polymerase sigma factor [Labilithrix luteola]